jgi:hypothetical protein
MPEQQFKNYPTMLSSSYSFVKHKGRAEMGYQAMPAGGPLVESKKASLGDAYIANYRSRVSFSILRPLCHRARLRSVPQPGSPACSPGSPDRVSPPQHGIDSSGYISAAWNERVINRPGKNLNV